MKKIFLGFLALSLMSNTAVLANNKKKAKAKTAKTAACPKDCNKSHCPMMGN